MTELTGMAVFPARYVVEEDYKQSYMIARDVRDRLVKIHILPNENTVLKSQQSSSYTIPLISEFAKTNRRALFSCIADPKNSKNSPFGILLCEQVTQVDNSMHKGHSFPTYHAKWASILRPDNEEPTPGLGIGYLEVNYVYPNTSPDKSFQAVSRLLSNFHEIKNSPAINPLDRETMLAKEAERIFHAREKRYASIIIKHKEIQENLFPQYFDAQLLRNIIENLVSKYQVNGRYGMALIRVRVGENVLLKHCAKYSMGYDYKNKQVYTLDQVWEQFSKYELNKLMSASNIANVSFDIIPCQKIFFGPKGISKCDKDLMPFSKEGVVNPPSKVMKQFIDASCHRDPTIDLNKSWSFLASYVGVRTARIESGSSSGNEIASTIHSFSRVVGNAITIRRDLSCFQLSK